MIFIINNSVLILILAFSLFYNYFIIISKNVLFTKGKKELVVRGEGQRDIPGSYVPAGRPQMLEFLTFFVLPPH